MGNRSDTAPVNPLSEIAISAILPCPGSSHESCPPQIFAPWLAELPVAQRDLLALLPVLDVNGAICTALNGGQAARPGVTAALLCVDPFLRVRDMAALLKAAGIGGVTNFPTVQVIDGVAALGFDSADLGAHREARMLARFAEEGLAVTGFATTAQNGQRLLDHGATALVVHPGPPSVDWRNRAIAARHAADTLQTLRPLCNVPLRLFCPDAYGAELDPARALADGLVRYA
ncbi:phosphoenolpyruvate hydrolase family protein [Roseinatronobacter alkalisoli]|uniref:Phosphoenolpyruvate hydrolase family protein n=1 Tax=Roseinatronobacter alkalisoli TaxID=3028235 RepID=A0ABT5TBU3_9RHOB|nr:phosphoenolpyruvate hydrolase family protein [Roseinatronobacter sp. HJB301]MDD7971642.1 phosphoenolpyruvate hydrolase family protein [Roseinatronobacter sp. HJB301]